jgi:hypothetical protein
VPHPRKLYYLVSEIQILILAIMSQNEGTEFSDLQINMSELLAIDGQRFNDGNRNFGQFINKAFSVLS